MRASCIRVALLIKRREEGLSDADRLVLEDHLASCEKCRQDAFAIDVLGELVDSAASSPLSSGARERAITRAIRDAAGKPLPPVRASRPAATLLVAVAVAGLGVALLLANRRPSDSPSRQATAATPRPEVAAGPLSLAKHATVSLAQARVSADEPTELSWDPARQAVVLREGAVSVSVDSAPGRQFRVLTPRFVVEVVGTEFRVDLAGVNVTRGIVRVLSPESEDLITQLGAGQSWSVPPAATPELLPAPARGRSASEWLARARRHLAAGATATAQRDVAAALAARPNRSETAEARTLLAECALVGGDPERAAELYVAVSQRYADLPAGETALFAAARIQVNAGHRREAEQLLRSYLDRYPSGRFQQEARARLRALERRE